MLAALHIQNFALIEELDLQFSNGLTVFTGETGSGKSIILGALHLIMGERADYSMIRNPNEKAIVEAFFVLNKDKYNSFFEANNLDFLPETIIRREINPAGKSRAFINDTPVQLTVLNELASKLVKIHSQYHTYALKSKQFQLELIDDLIGNSLDYYQQELKEFKHLQAQAKALQEKLIEIEKQADYIDFQLQELQELHLEKNNYKNLEQQLIQLENSTEILRNFSMLHQGLGDEDGIINRLNTLNAQLLKSANLHPELASLTERIHSLLMELKDIEETAIDAADNFDTPNESKELLVEKMDHYNRLLQKHHLSTQEELEELLNDFQSQNSSTEDLKKQLESLEKQLATKEKIVYQEAERLHNHRLKNRTQVIDKIIYLLKDLKMNDAQLEINVSKIEHLNEYGFSDVELFFTTNKGSELKQVSKAASGGELSRLMLVLEKLLSETKELPTLLLDEIDTGVSGEVALKMGNVLADMGKNMQLFAITHLPQVAAKGTQHLKVYKEDIADKTITQVKPLNQEERLLEIAGLMSGEKINEAAIENAKILMKP